MKIIFSPAKTFNFDASTKGVKSMFAKEAKSFANQISKLSKEDLGKRLAIKNKQLEQVFDWYQNFGKEEYTAIEFFNGIAFKQLTISEWSEKQKKWAQDNVLILDALHGAIRPFDKISPYRLDYTKSLVENKKLYKVKINELLNDEDEIINLASNEFSKMIKHENMKTLDTTGMNSVAGKKARGQKLNEYILKIK